MNVAFIPVRGGSKSIPLKNIKPICGKPLVFWVIKAACECDFIDFVYISTDCDDIKKAINGFDLFLEKKLLSKIRIIDRSAESATDLASTEFVMLEFADKYIFDNIVLIQATSPLLTSLDLDKGFNAFLSKDVDSVMSAVRQKRFNWRVDDDGYAHPTNYDVFNRPRRQNFEGYLVENGAFYITSRDNLLKTKNRVSGNIKIVEMDEDTFFEIDELSDWIIVEELMKKRGYCNNCVKQMDIKMFLTDCDGCLTDGGMYYSENGDELKKFNTRDGVGFSLLKKNGIITGIITGENVELNRRRAKKMKIDIIEGGCVNKLETVKSICSRYRVELKDVCYIGDDINDIDVIKAVGFGCCPSDAIDAVKDISTYVAQSSGGNGVIREISDVVLNCLQNK